MWCMERFTWKCRRCISSCSRLDTSSSCFSCATGLLWSWPRRYSTWTTHQKQGLSDRSIYQQHCIYIYKASLLHIFQKSNLRLFRNFLRPEEIKILYIIGVQYWQNHGITMKIVWKQTFSWCLCSISTRWLWCSMSMADMSLRSSHKIFCMSSRLALSCFNSLSSFALVVLETTTWNRCMEMNQTINYYKLKKTTIYWYLNIVL